MHSMIQLVPCLVVGAMAAGMWMTFRKAGQPGWWAVLPVFNAIGIIRAAGEPARFIWFLLIPLVNVALYFMLLLRIARYFGKSGWFGFGLFLLPFVFFPLIGFGDSEYTPDSSRPLAVN